MQERLYWLGFSVFLGIGPKRFRELLERFGSAKAAWNAKNLNLKKGNGESILNIKFDQFKIRFSPKDYYQKLQKMGISYLIQTDTEYPKRLLEIPNAPIGLFVKGNIEILKQIQDDISNCVSVVGTRKITQYGRDVTESLTTELVNSGFTVVSGLALGVDACSHQATLDAGGKTIAVLGCGVDCCFPRENQNLYNSIIARGGAVISEFPLGHPAFKGNFPARNRIVAGISEAVLVTEGAEDSGSLITAEYAFKFGRKVFAVPGAITSGLSKGPLKLLKKGAKLVTNGEDIIEELSIKGIKSTKSIKGRTIKADTKDEQKVLDILANEPLSFDEIAHRSKIPSAKLGSLLSMMELKGFVKSLDSGLFSTH